MKSISSSNNPIVRQAMALAKSSRERKQAGLSIISGIHLVQSYFEQQGAPLSLMVSQEVGEAALRSITVNSELQALLDLWQNTQPKPLVAVEGRLFTELAGLVQGGDVVAIVPTPRPNLPEQLLADCVVLDNLQDPGNVGSILRSAAAAGIKHVFSTPGSAFFWAPKVLRAAMGAHFSLQLYEAHSESALISCIRCPKLITSLGASQSLYQADLRDPVCWVFGNEGAGVSKEFERLADLQLKIPMQASTESLNVAASAAVCLFEQVRQRQFR